jgi:hypothetical protein
VASWQLHRGIGMGGDKYVGHVAGDDVEASTVTRSATLG